MTLPKIIYEKCNKEYPENDRKQDSTIAAKFYACNRGYGIVPPIGWYGYNDEKYSKNKGDKRSIPVVQRLPYWELSQEIVADDQKTRTETAASAELTTNDKYYSIFNQKCPMYVSTENEPSEATCCMHRYFTKEENEGFAQDRSKYNAASDLAKHLNIETIANNAYYRIFPKCAELLKYLPCAACHANMSKMAFEQIADPEKEYDYETSTGNANFFSYPLCTNYSREVYKQCRHVYYVTKYTFPSTSVDFNAYLPSGTHYTNPIVPDGFGERDFLELVHAPGLTINDDINASLDEPMENCIDPRIWNEKYK